MACCEAFLESLVIVLGLIKDTSGMTLELRAEAVEQVLTTLEDDCRYDVNRYPEIRVGAKNGSPEGFAERREEGGGACERDAGGHRWLGATRGLLAAGRRACAWGCWRAARVRCPTGTWDESGAPCRASSPRRACEPWVGYLHTICCAHLYAI